MNSKQSFLSKLPIADSRAAQAHLSARKSHNKLTIADKNHNTLIKQFHSKIQSSLATLFILESFEEIPATLLKILTDNQYPPQLKIAPDERLQILPWHTTPTIKVQFGTATDQDETGLSMAFCGIAETGTLMLISGPQSPTLLNFLPTIHIVILNTSQILANYEQAWALLRQNFPQMPRTINWITGPSRTADIEQTMQLGAHGPKQLYVLQVDDL